MAISGEIGPLNLISGAMLAQLALMIIVLIAEVILRSRQDPIIDIVTITSLSLMSLILLGMSDVFTGVWSPLFGGLSGMIEWKSSIFYFFLLNIFLTSFLVIITGGSDKSPYQAIYFLLPTLAIFLRESVKHVIIYTVLVIISFTFFIGNSRFNFGYPERSDGSKLRKFYIKRRVTMWLVSIACFLIAVTVGLSTRPH